MNAAEFYQTWKTADNWICRIDEQDAIRFAEAYAASETARADQPERGIMSSKEELVEAFARLIDDAAATLPTDQFFNRAQASLAALERAIKKGPNRQGQSIEKNYRCAHCHAEESSKGLPPGWCTTGGNYYCLNHWPK